MTDQAPGLEPEQDAPRKDRVTLTISKTKIVVAGALIAVTALIGGNVFQALGAQDADAAHRGQVARMTSEHADAMATQKAADHKQADKMVTEAVATQKRHDTKVLKRALRKQVSRRKREKKDAAEKAQAAGYSAGSSAGYSSGKTDGYSEGSADGYSEGSSDSYLFCAADDGYWC